MTDSADDEAVVEDGLSGDLDRKVGIRRYRYLVATAVVHEESGRHRRAASGLDDLLAPVR